MRISVLLVVLLILPVLGPPAQAETSRSSKHFVILLPVDVNQADAQTLDRVMDGIGPKKAQAIVQYREQHGPFGSIEELTRVKGIGAGTLARNRGRIVVK